MEGDRTRATIQRIAETLGLPQSALYGSGIRSADTTREGASQVMELLKLFSAVQDPERRLACLDYVRQQAGDAPPAATDTLNGHVHGL